jgi:hypothetical protein
MTPKNNFTNVSYSKMRPHSAKKDFFNFSAYKGVPDHTNETYKMFLLDEVTRDLASEHKSQYSVDRVHLKPEQITSLS